MILLLFTRGGFWQDPCREGGIHTTLFTFLSLLRQGPTRRIFYTVEKIPKHHEGVRLAGPTLISNRQNRRTLLCTTYEYRGFGL